MIAVLAAAMVYGVRSCVAPASPPTPPITKAPPSAVTVVFLPSQNSTQTADARAPQANPDPKPPLPSADVQPLRPQEPAIGRQIAPLRPHSNGSLQPEPAVLPMMPRAEEPNERPNLRPAPSSKPAERPQVTPLRPEGDPNVPVATAAPVPLRPRPAPSPGQAATKSLSAPAAEANLNSASAAPTPARQVSAPPAPAVPSARTEAVVVEGRALLRVLEHGSGPTIDIAWPVSASERERLYHHFKACFGMRSALIDQNGRLYTSDSRPGEPWVINLDRFSGFVRQTRGQVTEDENREVSIISARHRTLAGASPVRVFPRSVDALLLGHLRHAVGEGYATSRTIRAEYTLRGSDVVIEHIEVDGRRLDGRIDLPPVAGLGCRRGA